jgi:hypothetical protein
MEGDDQILFVEMFAGADSEFAVSSDGGKFELGSGIAGLEGHGLFDFRRWKELAVSRDTKGQVACGSKLVPCKKKGGLGGRLSFRILVVV